ncbi:Protein of unknown function DUF924 [Nitrosococcus oceani ATCC 19707]|uniref:Transmembrane protein n=2 Tax=Nitrosococcus oceani TaxID=1229 RepID=Q3JEV7_NITOC|nr:DUF924 family protein [Nitrosococcus oceani]ABA56639.1 Protein of unknown function DUF924 [Nitrosococcus oceani ATCC 19707]EDZ65489.1 conserved hypothetical protein [Nitrosococcus oceani AFC27]KFI20884.1 membrane protein [Nitrosococcus oceani C-27]GEM20791.1 membrane protein [Nitrosococcus oceani]
MLLNSMHHQQIIDFWFKEIKPESWWKKIPHFDQLIKERFKAHHRAAVQGELYEWRREPFGRLAEIIILDQFSRNIYRNHPLSFAYDTAALILSQEAIDKNVGKMLNSEHKIFLYMPFMHSESLKIHQIGIKLFAEPGLESQYDCEIKHQAIITRFGRYPHRNQILERPSTPAEIAFLKKADSSF